MTKRGEILKRHFLRVLLSLAAAVIFVLGPLSQANAAVWSVSYGKGWLAGYTYRKVISVAGTTDGAQTDYQLKTTIYKDVTVLTHDQTMTDVTTVNPHAGGNHAEGVASDGTYLYSSDRFHIYKMDKTGTILATRSNANLDGTAMEQVNSIWVQGDHLYVGANNAFVVPQVGCIKVYSKTDLSYIEEHTVKSGDYCEGCCYYKGYWWVVYFDTHEFISRYDTNWTWQADYSFTQGGFGTQGICTNGTRLFVFSSVDNILIYDWDSGTDTFTAIGTMHLDNMTALQGGGFEPGGEYLWVTDMKTQEVDGDIVGYDVSQLNLNGHCQDDFDDIRFTKSNGSTLLPHYIETYTSGISAEAWINIDSIPASPGTATIYVYYGNSTASSGSDGDDTFIFFDDFSGDLSKWSTMPAGWAIVDGQLRSNSAGWAYADVADATNLSLAVTINATSEATPNVAAQRIGFRSADLTSYVTALGDWCTNEITVIKTGEINDGINAWDLAANYAYRFRLIKLGTNWQIRIDENIVDTASGFASLTVGKIGLRTYDVAPTYWDYVAVRNVTTNPPTWNSYGKQKTHSSGNGFWILPDWVW